MDVLDIGPRVQESNGNSAAEAAVDGFDQEVVTDRNTLVRRW
jgi:hypothetical protein